MLISHHSKFPLGQIVATANAIDALTMTEIETALARHVSGDWGNVGDEDKDANNLVCSQESSPF